MDGQSKLELILELKNRMKTGLSKAKQSLNRNVTDMKGRLKDLKASHIETFSAMRSESALFDRSMELLGNPYVLLTAGLIALGALFYKSTQAAADFHREFLPMQQLNLDKSKQELDAYRNKILDVSMATGQSAADTTKAFYDIQSATGLFGDDVAKITEKVGNFSIATGATLPDSVNQTVKAMKAFGLGVEEIDGLLASNAKTVQVGITTFDELAKVQTEYAGAAAGAGQNVDTANKIFAAFTSIAKDSATAATMTKSAFEGLTQKNTIKGLKSIGISMYDANGQVRDLSAVLKEVSAKFKDMTPEQINTLINTIGGPEGLRNLFVKLGTGADDFFNTLEAYDQSKFNIDKALKNAKGDFNTLKQIVGNQLNVLMIKLGEKFLPKVAKGISGLSDLIEKVYNNFDLVFDVVKNVVIGLGIAKAAMIAFNIITGANPIGLIVLAIGALVAGITILMKKTEGWGQSWEGIKTIISAVLDSIGNSWNMFFDEIAFGIQSTWLRFKSMGQWVSELFSNVGEGVKMALAGDFSEAKQVIQKDINTEAGRELKQLQANIDKKRLAFADQETQTKTQIQEASKMIGIRMKKQQQQDDAEDATSKLTTTGDSPFAATSTSATSGTTTGNTASRVDAITGSTAQQKNITVNISKFVENVNIDKSEVGNMSMPAFEDMMNKLFLRVIRSVETSN